MSENKVRIITLEPMRVASAYAFGDSPELASLTKMRQFVEENELLEDGHMPQTFGFNNPNPSAGSPNYGYEVWLPAENAAIERQVHPSDWVNPEPAERYRWRAGDDSNPYLAYLGSADRFIVTAESASAKMQLTDEEQDILDGKKGKALAKVMRTVVDHGNLFGATKLVDLGGAPHTSAFTGTPALKGIIEALKEFSTH